MAWQTPKLDWAIRRAPDGTYLGDYFNAADYMRMKGNLEHIHELAGPLWPAFDLQEMPDVTVESLGLPRYLNGLEHNIDIIADHTFRPSALEVTKTWRANTAPPGPDDMNRLERSIFLLYSTVRSRVELRPKLAFAFKGDEF